MPNTFTFIVMSLFSATEAVGFAAADAMQAAYFRGFLEEERQQLVAEITKREAEVVKRVEAGQLSALGRLRTQKRAVEAELRYVDRLIQGLAGRFADR